MDKKEYIKYLADQGFSKEDILIKLRDFDRGIIDMPKKITDPVKTETSTGSIDDMVSNLGDFSSESPTTSMYGFELSEEDIKSIIEDRTEYLSSENTMNFNWDL